MGKIPIPPILIGLVVAGAIGSIWVTSAPSPAASIKRAANGCPVDQRPTATSLLLVDSTDPLTDAHLSQLRAAAGELKRNTPVDGKIIVAMLKPDTPDEAATILFEGCNPGTKAGDAYTDHPSPASIDQRWLTTFIHPLDAAIENATHGEPSEKNSPIIEAISEMAARADFDAQVPNRTLILISDGLQLTPKAYSHFQGGDLWAAYLRSPLHLGLQANLAKMKVEFVYLDRPQYAQRQRPAHLKFWQQWFAAHGTTDVQVPGLYTNPQFSS